MQTESLKKTVGAQLAEHEQAPAKTQHKLFLADSIGFVEVLDIFGDDLLVVNAARVSFNKESSFEERETETDFGTIKKEKKLSTRDAKLINYLAQHKHITPFFHPQLRFRIKMPIFLAREWFRHTIGFARNEVSRRYIDSEPECFVPSVLRQRDQNLKQGSKLTAVAQNEELCAQMRDYCNNALIYYRQLLDQGVCPEQARLILPQSMYTEFIETASLSAYARLVGLRAAANAQKEIQEYALMLSSLIEPHFPVSWRALAEAEDTEQSLSKNQ